MSSPSRYKESLSLESLPRNLGSPSAEKDVKSPKFHNKVEDFLHNKWVHGIIVIFVVVDAALVIASILIDMDIIRDPGADGKLHYHNDTRTYSCVREEKSHGLHKVSEALHISSLVILCLFMAEVLLNIYAQRERFFKSKLHVMDAFIVALSLAFDIAVISVEEATILDSLGLIVLLRLWRIIRIIEIVVVASRQSLDEDLQNEKEHRESYEHRAKELGDKLAVCQDRYHVLRARLTKYEHVVDEEGDDVTKVPPYLPDTDEIPRRLMEDTADESEDDRLSVQPPQQRTGNTYTVKKDGVRNTAL